ncbi:MAG: hypothetical protein JXR46_11285 [Calditrichaceae bacterium]|nr:hypothetical protein [Calditrichaceae bacterium]MBN2709617.1 hypothetical protein [Calditrichaceae bacterium]RQV92414.1 MAG: hypothetical protein EH224_15550 [Calditrichota bacterium]
MNWITNPAKRLSFFLYLIALHSFSVGLGLILHPDYLMSFAGYDKITEPFFPVQGGIFHIIMAVCYFLGAYDLIKHRCLVIFAIFIKTFATLFLFTYYIFVDQVWMILFSGFTDGFMALFLYLAFISYNKTISNGS